MLVADRKRLERVVKDLDECPDLEHVLLVDCEPDGPRPRRTTPGSAASTSSPTEPTPDLPDDRHRRGRPRHHPLHERHDRPPQGRGQHPPQHDRQPPEHAVLERLRRRWSAATSCSRPAGQTVSAVHEPAVPRVRPALRASSSASSPACASSWSRAASTRSRRSRSSRTRASPSGRRSRRWCGASASTPARHDYDTSTVRNVAFGGSPSADELQRMVRDTFPNVKGGSNAYGLTESSSVATLLSAEEAQERPELGRPTDADGADDDADDRRRRGADHRPDDHGRRTGASPRRPPRPSRPTAGCAPATSATSTTTATSTSPTARRT